MLSNDKAYQAVLPSYETKHGARENSLSGGISILYKQKIDLEVINILCRSKLSIESCGIKV